MNTHALLLNFIIGTFVKSVRKHNVQFIHFLVYGYSYKSIL